MEQENLKSAAAAPLPVVPTLEEKLQQAENILATPNVEVKKNDLSLPPIRTYQSDVADAIKRNNTSMIQIALAEAKKKERDLNSPEYSSKKNVALLVGGILFLLLGLGVGGFFALRSTPKPVEVTTEIPIILTDSEKEIDITDLTRNEIVTIIQGEKTKQAGIVGRIETEKIVYEIEPSTRANVRASDFMESLGTQIPQELARSFGDKFVFGFHSLQKKEPFLILKTNSYQNTFAGMLEWESNMVYDLQGIFLNTTLQTSSNKENFNDEVLANKDARVVRDEDGKIIFLYAFIDKETLLITTNTLSVKEISERIRAAKLVR